MWMAGIWQMGPQRYQCFATSGTACLTSNLWLRSYRSIDQGGCKRQFLLFSGLRTLRFSDLVITGSNGSRSRRGRGWNSSQRYVKTSQMQAEGSCRMQKQPAVGRRLYNPESGSASIGQVLYARCCRRERAQSTATPQVPDNSTPRQTKCGGFWSPRTEQPQAERRSVRSRGEV
jgi:hypothetical protein